MQDITNKQKSKMDFKIKDLSLEDKNRLVGAFVWLVKQDKRQNPAFYKLIKKV